MRKLSEIPAPALAGVVREKSTLSAIAEIKNCAIDGATMIDLHLSCLENTDVESLKRIVNASKIPILALNYNTRYDWSGADLTEEERIDSFMRAVEAGVAGIDMQAYTYHLPSKTAFCGEDKYSFTKNNPREVVTDEAVIAKQCELIEKVHLMGAEVLLSCHPGIQMPADQVVDLALFLEKRKPDIIKIVTWAPTEDDMYEGIRAMTLLKQQVKTPVSYHVNGKFGGLSRIINPLLGGQIAFCIDRYNEGSTMEQIDLRSAKAMLDALNNII